MKISSQYYVLCTSREEYLEKTACLNSNRLTVTAPPLPPVTDGVEVADDAADAEDAAVLVTGAVFPVCGPPVRAVVLPLSLVVVASEFCRTSPTLEQKPSSAEMSLKSAGSAV